MPRCRRPDDGARRNRRDRLFAHGAELEAGGSESGDRLVEALADERRDGLKHLRLRAEVSGRVVLREREPAGVAGRERAHFRLVLARAEGAVALAVDVEHGVAELVCRVETVDPPDREPVGCDDACDVARCRRRNGVEQQPEEGEVPSQHVRVLRVAVEAIALGDRKGRVLEAAHRVPRFGRVRADS